MKSLLSNFFLVFSSSFLFLLSCSGYIDIVFYGKLIGYENSPSNNISFNFHTYHNKLIKALPEIDSLGNYKLPMSFFNAKPQCMSLLINNVIHDRFCFNYKTNVLTNIFNQAQINTPRFRIGNSYEIKNMDFILNNYKSDSLALSFDSVKCLFYKNYDKKQFEFLISDPSKSIDLVTAYYPNSAWKSKKVILINNKFEIPFSELDEGKAPVDNTIIIDIHSKYGWYTYFTFNLYESIKN